MTPAGPGAQGLVSASGDPEDQNKVHSASASPQMPIARFQGSSGRVAEPKGPAGASCQRASNAGEGHRARQRPTPSLRGFSSSNYTNPQKQKAFPRMYMDA